MSEETPTRVLVVEDEPALLETLAYGAVQAPAQSRRRQLTEKRGRSTEDLDPVTLKAYRS